MFPDMRAVQAKADWLSLTTLVMWVVCIAVGLLGFALPYPRVRAPVPIPPPMKAEIIRVELTDDPLPQQAADPSTATLRPPDLQPVPTTAAPAVAEVAVPSPAIAFAMPVDAPARIVEASRAAPAQASTQPEQTPGQASGVKQLVVGEGEGRQQAPEYPAVARRQGQQGTVVVRFTVGEDGRVLSTEAIEPSPWPMLRDAALRGIKERWQFARGEIRVYQVSIRFQLTK